jgi:hypothetical protein
VLQQLCRMLAHLRPSLDFRENSTTQVPSPDLSAYRTSAFGPISNVR